MKFNVNSETKDKMKAANEHQKLISLLQKNHENNIIIYSDDSKFSDSAANAESFILFELNKQKSYS